MDLKKRANQLAGQVNAATDKLEIGDKAAQLDRLSLASQQADFWNDSSRAQDTMKKIAELERQIQPWQDLIKETDEAVQLAGLSDAELADELSGQLDKLESKFENLKQDLKFTGKYDGHSAILSIYAGAGGTDAQDWAGMLLKMYLRFAEKQGWQAKLLAESAGEEAGIKSATLEIAGGAHVYGKLRGEHGVHRLVRQSPFNSAASRETSFAKVDVLPEIDQPDDVLIDDKDLKIDVYRSGGHGGQSVNTTDSAVRVTHLPTGISVAIQNERSQIKNKAIAMTILRSQLAQLQLEQHADKISQLKGPDKANEFGSQIRNYVLHPYKQVKDLRSGYETSDPEAVLDGTLDGLIEAYLEYALGDEHI